MSTRACELAEIARRQARAGGPALLFDRVAGCGLPIVANLLASETRAARLLGLDSLGQLTERAESLVRHAAPQGWLDRLKGAPEPAAAQRFRAKTVRSAACQQIVRRGRDIDLAQLAALQLGQAESHRSITGALLVQSDPLGTRRLTPCRLLLLEPTRLAVIDDGPGDWTRQVDAAHPGREAERGVFSGGRSELHDRHRRAGGGIARCLHAAGSGPRRRA